MYIVGHCIVTEYSQVVRTKDIYGDGIFGLMLPDYIRCHDWGYARCFDATWHKNNLDCRMMEAHLLGDWFVHYGPCTTERKREGFAYRKMGVYARRYNEFFTVSSKMGLREDHPPCDSVRGFSHTMVEYTVDTYLSRKGRFDDHFQIVKEFLGELGLRKGSGSQDWVNHIIEDKGIVAETPNLSDDLNSFRSRVASSDQPEDLAINAGVKKFGLNKSAESRDFMRRFLLEGLSEFSETDLETFIQECSCFIARWMQIA